MERLKKIKLLNKLFSGNGNLKDILNVNSEIIIVIRPPEGPYEDAQTGTSFSEEDLNVTRKNKQVIKIEIIPPLKD